MHHASSPTYHLHFGTINGEVCVEWCPMAMAEMVADFMTKPLQLQGSIFNKISKDLIIHYGHNS